MPDVTATRVETNHPNPYAQLPGQSVPEMLAGDRIQTEPHYMEPSFIELDAEDISIERYFSREWHDREVEKIWKKTWQVACREEDIASPGDFITYEIVDDNVVVVRQSDGSLKAYINACLHRGNQLCEGQGHAKALRCPFHGFTWSLEGKLRYIPGEWDFPQLNKEKFSLPEVQVGSWGGFVFINLDPEAGPLEDYLEILPEHLDGDELANRYKAAHVSQVVPCNWKVVQEAFIEGYHVAETHFDKSEDGVPDPAGMATIVNDTATQYDSWPGVKHIDRLVQCLGVPSQYVAHKVEGEQHILDTFLRRFPKDQHPVLREGERARDVAADFLRRVVGERLRKDLSGVSTSSMLDQIQYNIFPNFTVWPALGAPLCYRFRPYGNDPDRAIFEIWYLIPRPDSGETPPVAKDYRLGPDELWATRSELGSYGPIVDQDSPNLRRLQKGLKATRKRGITLARYQEIRVRRFERMVDEYLAR